MISTKTAAVVVILASVSTVALLVVNTGKTGSLVTSGEATPETSDPAIKEKIEALEDVLEHRENRDMEAVEIIGELLEKYQATMNPMDRRDAARAVGRVFTADPVRPPDQLALYDAAAKALGKMGREGALVLLRTTDAETPFPKTPEWVPLRVQLLDNLGETNEEGRIVGFLINEATRSPEKALMAAAGGALGNYAQSRQKQRKEIVNRLLVRWGELDARWREGNLGPNDIGAQTAQEYLATIVDKWNSTLSSLTGQKLGALFDWQRWWNANKNVDWDLR